MVMKLLLTMKLIKKGNLFIFLLLADSKPINYEKRKVEKRKARLVARGFMQKVGLGYFEV